MALGVGDVSVSGLGPDGGGAARRRSARKSVMFVAKASSAVPVGMEESLPSLAFELPHLGRIWLVVVGDGGGQVWQSTGRRWAALLPSLQLSVICLPSVPGSNSKGGSVVRQAVQGPSPSPWLHDGRQLGLRYPKLADAGASVGGRRLAGITLGERTNVTVLSPTTTPLAAAIVAAIGPGAALVVTGDVGAPTIAAGGVVVLCAVGDAAAVGVETACAAAAQCVTICNMAALVPSLSSAGRAALASAEAAAASARRARAGHSSWVLYAPPLMDRLWFEPAAPAGSHRCSVESFVAALTAFDMPAADAIIGAPDAVPKHWADVLAVGGGGAERSAAELRAFLVNEVAEAIGIEPAAVAEEQGLEDLGVSSLDTLRLSQRIRRFLGRSFSAFALQNNPTVAELVRTLSVADKARAGAKGKVLCLHGYHTSSAVLQQQMLPLTAILDEMGYEIVVPDGPHRAGGGDAFSAAGLDTDDAYGWWLYDGDAHNSPTVGLERGIEVAQGFGPVDGIIGFSQGGAMAAQVADAVNAPWAVLFSPVFIPQMPARCGCRALVVFDRADEVMPATATLVAELAAAPAQIEHRHGHRLPPSTDADLYARIAAFLRAEPS